MKKLIAAMALVVLFCALADAREPEKGDYVRIHQQWDNDSIEVYEGNITDICDGMICMDCMNIFTIENHRSIYPDYVYPLEICMGLENILSLSWGPF